MSINPVERPSSAPAATTAAAATTPEEKSIDLPSPTFDISNFRLRMVIRNPLKIGQGQSLTITEHCRNQFRMLTAEEEKAPAIARINQILSLPFKVRFSTDSVEPTVVIEPKQIVFLAEKGSFTLEGFKPVKPKGLTAL